MGQDPDIVAEAERWHAQQKALRTASRASGAFGRASPSPRPPPPPIDSSAVAAAATSPPITPRMQPSPRSRRTLESVYVPGELLLVGKDVSAAEVLFDQLGGE
jgi:hypothetical protein